MAYLDNGKIRKFLAGFDSEPNTARKGKQLEDLVCYIMEGISGVKLVGRIVYVKYFDQEIDLIVLNNLTLSGLYFLPSIIAFECKNLAEPVSKNEIILFAKKLKNKNITLGIVVARSGVTGKESKGTYAYGEIQRTLHEGCKILVITGQDLEKITNTLQVVAMLEEKLCNLVIPVRINSRRY